MTELQLREAVALTAKGWKGLSRKNGTHKVLVDLYNSYHSLPLRNGKPYHLLVSDNWCAAFVSDVAIATGLTSIIPVECSCTNMIELHKALGQWVEDDRYRPQIGDIVMYYWQDGADYATTDQKHNPNHTGIVTDVNGDTFTVTEGNMGPDSAVGDRKMTVNGRYIRGFCCPNYAATAEAMTPVTPEPEPVKPWYADLQEWVKEKGISGPDRPEDTCTRAEVWQMLKNMIEGEA